MQPLPAQPVELPDGELEAKSARSEVTLDTRLRPPGRPSPKLVQMLADLTPEQREQAVLVTARLLALRAKKKA